ncbi:MAG: glycerol-3-phosphate 1-O-acyltransferase PlsY [Candidatus Krumholzibacteria bacterium]|nr:glycerol-3-phosphate 1-O-acyltransferase PlsY [Candidatus Krumholzibacteria bacterium]
MIQAALLLLLSFLLGSLPFAWIAGRLSRGIDLREHGSGNPGASNAWRLLGKKWGITVLLLDAAKGTLAVLLTLNHPLTWLPLLAGLFAVLGHSFSPFLSFRGGKGVATSAGAFLALSPLPLLSALLVFLLSLALFRMISVSSMLAALGLPFLIRFLQPLDSSLFWLSVGLAFLVCYRHRSNMARLFRGEEPRLGKS